MASISDTLAIALEHHRAGQLSEAERLYQAVLQQEPEQADALHLLGVLAYQQGQWPAAVDYYQQALAQRPRSPEIYLNFGNVLRRQGLLTEALAAYEQAIALKPNYSEAHHSRGLTLQHLDQLPAAITAYEQAIALRSDYPEALHSLGVALRQQGRTAEAIAAYEAAIALRPEFPEVYYAWGNLLREQGNLPAAIARYEQAIALRPDYTDAHLNLGVSHQSLGQLEAAEACYRHAITLDPGAATAHHNLGLVLQALNCPAEAIAAHRQSLELDPNNAEALNNLGVALKRTGDVAGAIAHHRQALALRPDYVEGHHNLGIALLTAGQLREGFAEYEWRWQLRDWPPRPFEVPRWQGEDLQGKTLLLHAEQGLGDTIQFLRYAQIFKARGARVILECQAPLKRLVRDVPWLDAVAIAGDPLPPFEVHLPLLSAPHALSTDLDSIPGQVPYLAAPATGGPQLPQGAGRRVGLVWAGNPQHKDDRNRSCSLAALAPLFQQPDLTWYSLQKGDRTQDLAQTPTPLHNLDPLLQDFVDTAAAIAQLDLVITVDTSVAHLAGALGKPVWILLAYDADWRWLTERTDSPWYPTARLFRQAAPGDWAGVVAQVTAALAEGDRPSADLSREALQEQGQAALSSGNYVGAIAAYQQLLAQWPDTALAHHYLGLALQAVDRYAEARQHYERAIALDASLVATHINLGSVCQLQGDEDTAIAHYRAAIARRPDVAAAHLNLGSILKERGDLEEALLHCKEAVRLQSDLADAHHNLGVVYQGLGDPAAAIACYERALALNPEHVDSHFGRAIAWLQQGQWAEGWAEYEWRWRSPKTPPRDFAQPRWDGGNLTGKTILLHAEQGYGDTIQFIRYAALAKAQGARVLVECQSALVRLLQELPFVDQVLPKGATLPPFEVQAPLLSLPWILGTTPETVPAEQAYLRVPAAAQQGIQLPPQAGPRVAIVWAGSPQNTNDRHRSCSIAQFEPLFQIPGVAWYSLQKGPRAAELAHASVQIQSLDPILQDFADTAAAIAQLDLVITVDTSVAHVAGALGKDVWILLPFDADWRWLRDRADSPWYPTARLFRQGRPGDWASAFAQVAAALGDRLKSRQFEPTAPASRPVTPAIAALLSEAVALHQAGQRAEAAQRYQAVLRQDPHQPNALHLLGVVAYQSGDPQSAIAYYRRSLAQQADFPEAHYNLAIALSQMGDLSRAIHHYQQAIAQKPDYADAHYNLATALKQTQQLSEAVTHYRAALRLAPTLADAHARLASTLQELGQPDDAIDHYRQAVTLDSNLAGAHNNLANLLRSRDDFEGASRHYQAALALLPDFAEGHYNLGGVLKELGRLPEAIAAYQQALDLKPGLARAHNNLGACYAETGDLERAIAAHERAIALEPDYVEAHDNLGHVLLRAGDLVRGFAEYEWRWQLPDQPPNPFGQWPLWDGGDLTGKTLLVHAEQGYGDTLNFVRYLPWVKNRGGQVIFECQPALERLLTTAEGCDGLVPRGKPLPAFDVQVPLLSLPWIFGTTLETIPASVPYLRGDAFEVPVGAAQTLGGSGKRVGFVWAGNPEHKNDRNRSCPLAKFQGLFEVPGIAWYSLQKGDRAADLTKYGDRVTDLGQYCQDFADTAAVIAQLDLVITVDTSVAHVAGALGKPVWILLSFVHDWRWLSDRDDSPWYPTARLFRQPTPGDWDAVLAAVQTALPAWREQDPPAPAASPDPRSLETAIALINQGYQHSQQGHSPEAIACYRTAVDVCPTFAEGHLRLGVALRAQGDPAALDHYQKALALDPHLTAAHYNLGNAYQTDQPQQAIAAYQQALALQPDFAPAHYNLANLLRSQDQGDRAEQHYRLALRFQPDHFKALHNLASLYLERQDYRAAIAHYQQVLALRPELAEAQDHLGIALRKEGRLSEAIAAHHQALALNPEHPSFHTHLGVALKESGDLDGAIAAYERAIALDADCVEAHLCRALAWLTQGHTAQGWAEYEWRWRVAATPPRPFRQPQWSGDDLAGRTLLVHAEQGLGDTLQFVRYLTAVQERGARVVVECQRPLLSLLQPSFPDFVWVAQGDRLPDFEVHIPLMSLPHCLAMAEVPGAPYLTFPAEVASVTLAERPTPPRYRVGIVWAGNPKHPNNQNRSCPLETFLPLFELPGIAWYSLLKGDRTADLQALGVPVENLDPQIQSFADTAAAIAQLDLVITVDTSVAHLAGALGKPVWVLLAFDADWRWLRHRADSPWYPTARLFRQPRPRDWASVIAQVAETLRPALREPTAAEALNAQGIAAQNAGDWQQAIAAYRQAIDLQPDFAQAHYNLGTALQAQKRDDEALAAYQRAIALDPGLADAYNNLGNLYRSRRDIPQAIAAYRQAIDLQPQAAIYHSNLGSILQQADQYEGAIAHYQQAIDLDPQLSVARYNLGNAYYDLGEFDRAIALYQQVLRADPDCVQAQFAMALVWLQQGDFRRGFAGYEARWALGELRQRSFTQPAWDGQPLQGRRILIYGEQGYGDTIQFLRLVPWVVARGGQVVLEVPRRLLRLVQGFGDLAEVYAIGDAPLTFDCHAALMSLPHLLGLTLETIPANIPYLEAPAAANSPHFQRDDRLSVGIVWAGRPSHINNHHRSCSLAQFAPLLDLPGVAFYSLQKGDGCEELAQSGDRLQDWGQHCQDFADTAAAIEALDLVITVDTSVAHLAGALGKPVWILLAFDADWRWLRDRPDSPWYPTARLFRQPRLGDWGSVFGAVAAALGEQIPGRSPAEPEIPELALAIAHLSAGQPEAAIALLELLVPQYSTVAEVHYLLGLAYRRQHHLIAAQDHYQRAIALQPNHVEAHLGLGVALKQQGQLTEAIAHYRQVLDLRPDYPEAHNNLANALKEQGQWSEAIAHYQRALALRPDFVAAHNNLANALQRLDRIEEAVAHYRRAIALQPDYAEAYNNLGNALQSQLDHPGAIAAYRQALQIKPDYAEAHLGLAAVHLIQGDLAQGFGEYEWRWQVANNPDCPPMRPFTRPLWDGSPLSGQRILLHAEQGYGDTIQFIRYATVLAEQGATVLVESPRALLRLVATVAGVSEVVAKGDELPDFDCHAPLLSLPHRLGTTLETVPAAAPYLRPPAAPPRPLPPGLQIGLVWSGNPRHKNNHHRSCPLTAIAPLFHTPGTHWYSLQKGPAVDELAAYADRLADWGSEFQDFGDTAAAIAQLDLVITVDTSVAHLAGALGKPVWVLLTYAPDWRWLLERSDCPWYPTARLFRQGQTDVWEPVITEVGTALAALAAQASPSLALDRAIALHQAGNLAAAKAEYGALLTEQPTALLQTMLGILAFQEQRPEAALAHYRQAIALDPGYADAHYNLGVALSCHSDLEGAIACYQRVLVLQPRYFAALHNLATAYHQQQQFEEAIAFYEQALQLQPDHAEAHYNLGLAHRQCNNLEAALAHYDRAIALQPDYAEAHWNRALALLLAGRFREGFAEYEWRWRRPGRQPVELPKPPWRGEPLAGKTLLIYADQGFGDAIQFCRFIPQVVAQGAQVILECRPPLIDLLRSLPGITHIVPRGEGIPASFDYHTSLMSLPHYLGIDLETLPAQVPYLAVPDRPIALAPRPGTRLKVGVAWAGSPTNLNDHNRSCPMAAFRRLFEVTGVTWYSLQKGDRTQDLAGLSPERVINLDDQIQTFADTAAAIAQLDLVITVDTSVAHLAGALGKPVWILLPYSPDWRWLIQRSDSPWYPTARLFRQSSRGQWDSVLETVLAALTEAIAHPADSLDSPAMQTSSTPSITLQTSAPVKCVGLGWPPSLLSGWGVYGMNLALQTARRAGYEPLMISPPSLEGLNPLHLNLLQPIVQRQQSLHQFLAQNPDKKISGEFTVLHALGNDFASRLQQRVTGKRNLGVVFFENSRLSPEIVERAQSYDAIVAGCSWNAEVLRQHGVRDVRMVPQGIDPTIFHPAPRSNWFGDRFVIFSGGKLEYRKGQDIVVAAFKIFQARHPEALLITAWHNFWPQFMAGLEQTGNVVGLPQVGADRRLRVTEWLVANGIPAGAVLDVGPVVNYMMGQILREADAAIFPNRCEGGTNLVAMECLACGVPSILSANTGHRDLLQGDHCYVLQDQGPVKPSLHFSQVEDWGESRVEEVVAHLETIYQQRAEARSRGLRAAQFMEDWTWEKQIGRLLTAIDDLL
ncbi:glycosyl transferase family 9 [Geitlerinema sp. PCC 7407]|nr:tetratricopeptide repeat protein [Geitlerinema sp. PCC 7407]AFY64842.1 glycosyl transferase family 9 [Geitlerinema sp. PCC 7407]